MTVDHEPAPKPAPLWALPLTIAVLALALLWSVEQFAREEVTGFGGRAQPITPVPDALADGSTLPDVPEVLTRRFGDEVVLAERLDDVPGAVNASCRERYADETGPARAQLHELIASADAAVTHLGPDALTHLSIALGEPPPGYPQEVKISCIARMDGRTWQSSNRPLVDFALDGRPGAHLSDPDLRSRLVQIPVGARWAVAPRGGWWLAYDVRDTSWTLMTVTDAITERDALRVTFVDDAGQVVADRPVGPTRSAASSDHSAELELIAGDVPIVLDRLSNGPIRICDPSDANMCVWLAFNELEEITAVAGFGPHPLDTPPMGYIGYCPKADLYQGSLTSAQFRTDGTWAGGPNDRGLDRYGVRYEAGKVVIDLTEHVAGEPADDDPIDDEVECVFSGKARGKAPD